MSLFTDSHMGINQDYSIIRICAKWLAEVLRAGGAEAKVHK
jgi:hypothetical protein